MSGWVWKSVVGCSPCSDWMSGVVRSRVWVRCCHTWLVAWWWPSTVDVVVVWHVDRLVRRLVDLEDVIERSERAGVRLATVSGDIDLSTDAGRLVGRILASVARGEMERKGVRQRSANQQRAERGQPPSWGHRAFGYERDGRTVRPVEEAAVIAACEQLLSGGSLRSVAKQWQAADLELSRPDAAELLIDHDRPDLDELRAEAQALRARLESVADEFADGELNTTQLRRINERIKAKLSGIEATMAEAGRLSVLGPLVRAEDVRAVWDDLMDLDRRRAVIGALFTITVASPGYGRKAFDPDTVTVDWRQP